MRALILYSTTTRRTETIATRLADDFSRLCETHLSTIETWDLDKTPAYDLVIAGGPTAGQGELHLRWRKVAADVSQLDMRGRHVALFALGDQRHHGGTFGAALWLLHELWEKTGATIAGGTRFDGYLPESCPQLQQGQKLPGLLLDHIAQRRLTRSRLDNWIGQLQQQIALPASG
jgi:flavodoxin II